MARLYGYSEAEIAEMAEQRALRQARREARALMKTGVAWIAPEHARDVKTMKRDSRGLLIIDTRPTLMVKRPQPYFMPKEPEGAWG